MVLHPPPLQSPDGRFRAVVTTGIYCRDTCTARPAERNVYPVRYAAAAEAAGFRPCRRCRPDESPGPAAWTAGPELVCRALQCIADGDLDGPTTGDLARRLGTSERHLRRLFDQHVGTSPDVVARSRRAHLARRLLVDSDLRIADVAFAAGFQSVRQMNRVIQTVFRTTPSQLRRSRRSGGRPRDDGQLELRLAYTPPFDWDALWRYLAARATPGVEVADASRYQRTVLTDSGPGLIEVRPGADDHVTLRVLVPSYRPLAHVVARARRICDLDADPAAIAAGLGADPLVGPMVAARPGLRLPGVWSAFEFGVRAILGQQVTVTGASTMAGRLAGRLGDTIGGTAVGSPHVLFPTAERLADADLTTVGLTRQRAAAVSGFARAVSNEDITLDGTHPLPELVAALTSVAGIGEWTGQVIAMRAGPHPDAFCAGDKVLREAAATNGTPLTIRELEARAEAWRPWRAYAAMHLWQAAASTRR